MRQFCHKSSMGGMKLRILQGSVMTRAIFFLMTITIFMLGARLISLPLHHRKDFVKHEEEEVERYDRAAPEVQTFANPMPIENKVPLDAAALVKKIKAMTRRVVQDGAVGSLVTEFDSVFTPSMQSLWHKSNPCRSRHEIYSLYSLRKAVPTNQKWSRVFDAYEVLHRTCVLRMGNVTEFFLSRKNIQGCRFVVGAVHPGAGLGNKVMATVSAMLYAVLTQRVLLVPLSTGLPGVFCEPFEGSSWKVDPDQLWSEGKQRKDLWVSLKDFYEKVDKGGDHNANSTFGPTYAAVTTEPWDFQPQPRFFCDTEQGHYSRVKWVGFRNNLYFVPKLFAIPSFRPVLEDLFPDRSVMPHLLRSVLLPCDQVWGRVKQVHDAHFRHAEQRIGIQIRYFHGKSEFDSFHGITEDHVEECLIENGLLPDPKANSPEAVDFGHTLQEVENTSFAHMGSLKVTTVFVTSLYQSLYDRLTKSFVRSALGTGDAVAVVQLTHEDEQYYGVEVDRQALTEMVCLSLTDHLILTPQSTFGAVAQGYGAHTPWFIDIRPHTVTPCVKGRSPEICYQIPASKNYLCPHDVSLNGKQMSDVVAYISDCHLVEEPYFKVNGAGLGMQLLTSEPETSQHVF